MKKTLLKLSLACLALDVMSNVALAQPANLLGNPGFEQPGVAKTTNGFSSLGGPDGSWADDGVTYTNTGVENAGAHRGAWRAYEMSGDNGAYQIADPPAFPPFNPDYTMSPGDQITLIWWALGTADPSTGNTNPPQQVVGLIRANTPLDAFNTTTPIGTVTKTGLTGAWTQYTLNYTAISADANKYIGVYFGTTNAFGVVANSFAGYDDFYLGALPAGSKPSIATPPVSQTNYSGATVSFAVAAVGATGYQWMAGATGSGVFTNLLNAGQFSGVNTSVLTITNVMSTNNGDYIVVVTNGNGSVTSAPPAKLLVLTASLPVITNEPVSQTNYSGATVSFAVGAVGATGYQWEAGATGSGVYTNLMNGGQFSGVNTTNLTITSVTPGNSGNYVVVVSNGYGSVTSTPPANLSVLPVIITPPSGQTNYSCVTVSFSVSAVGATGYQWKAGATGSGVYTNLLNAGQFTGVNTPNLTITNVTASNSGDYVVVVSNGSGSVTSTPPANLLVLSSPPVITTPPTGVTNYSWASVSFTVSAVGATGYQWKAGATGSGVYTNLLNAGQFSGVNTSVLAITSVTPGNNGDYVVVVSNCNGSVTSTPPANLTVLPVIPPVGNLLGNPGFEQPGIGKTTNGFSSLGGPDGSWTDDGVNYTNTGVDNAGAHGGSYRAYEMSGDDGAYQIADTTAFPPFTSPAYQMTPNDQITLTWWAIATVDPSTGNTNPPQQVVGFIRANTPLDAFNTTTRIGTPTVTGLSGAWTQYTMNYTAQPADSGKYIGVYFNTTNAFGRVTNSFAGYDDFYLAVPPIGCVFSIVCPSNITLMTCSTGAVVNYTVTFSCGCLPGTTSCVPPSGSIFPIGTTTVNCSATDSCGRSNTCSFTVTVDVPAPLSITCPSNITVLTTCPSGAVVNYSVMVSDGVPPYRTNCVPPSGSIFPIGTNTVNCSVTDSCGQANSCSFTVTVGGSLSISNAIQNGVAWLVNQQKSDGSWSYPPSDHRYTPVAYTGLAVVKLEEHAFELGYPSPFDDAYPYKTNVINGLNYLFNQATTNGAGIAGICFVPGDEDTESYSTGIAMMAIAASRNPTNIVNVTNSLVNGMTYNAVLQSIVDYFAAAQNPDGGWRYYASNEPSDNSNSGFAAMGLRYAETPIFGFHCVIPASLNAGLNSWINAIQVSGGINDGGSDYMVGANWVNVLKTGNLLFEMALVGDNRSTQRVQRAVAYIQRNWNDSNEDPGWKPHNYLAMDCMMEGFGSLGITNITVNGTNVDWFGQFADAIVASQQCDGSWPQDVISGVGQYTLDPMLSTELALIILERIPPVEALQITPATGFTACGGVGGPFTVTNETFSLSNIGTNSLTWSLTNTSSWLVASASGGALTNSGTTNVTVSLSSNAYSLTTGVYQATIWFTNLTNGVGQSRQFTLIVIPSPIISKIIHNTDGSVTLYLLTATNLSSYVLATTNLAPLVIWQSIYTNVVGTNGAWQFTDTNASWYPIRFYRAATPLN